MKLFILVCMMAAVVLAQGPSKRTLKRGDHQLNRDNPFGVNPHQMHYPTIPKTAINSPKVITGKLPVDIKSILLREIAKMPIPEDVKETGNANEFMDQILAAVRASIIEQNLDPYIIAESDAEGIILTGELYGLSTLHRAGDATFTYEKGIYTLDCTVGIYDMTAEVKWSTSISFITYNGDASLSLEVFEMQLKASAQIRNETQDFLTLDDLQITATTGVDIEVHVLPGLNWIIETVATPIIRFFDRLLTLIVENVLTGIFESVFESIPIPGSYN